MRARASLSAVLIFCALASSAARAEIRRYAPPVLSIVSDVIECTCFDMQARAVVACPAIAKMFDERLYLVSIPFERAKFDAIDKTFALWGDGGRQYDDGTWQLAQYLPGLERGFTTVSADTGKLAAWRQAAPTSIAAQLAEAWMWYFHARRLTASDPHMVPSKEAKAMAKDRLGKALAILDKMPAGASDTPAWDEARIAVLVEQGALAKARRVFDAVVKRYPRYHPLYQRMSAAYTGAAFEQFVNEAVKQTEGFEGGGQYARLYRWVDTATQMPFDAGRPRPDWDRLRRGYGDLLERYPGSIALATHFAAVACRSDDSALYRTMRTRADEFLVAEVFNVVPLDACDRRHGWSRSAP